LQRFRIQEDDDDDDAKEKCTKLESDSAGPRKKLKLQKIYSALAETARTEDSDSDE
jgi:hypothetical protein